jgi:hypothetical protein
MSELFLQEDIDKLEKKKALKKKATHPLNHEELKITEERKSKFCMLPDNS